MEPLKITVALIIAILLQWTLRNVAEPLAFVNFPLIIVVYAALERNSIRAILFGTVSGLFVDALSGGLMGASGFTMTVVAFIVSEIARRVYLDNLLLRIPVIAGACVLNLSMYYGLHRLFGQPPAGDPLISASYSLIGTTIAGTLIYLLFDKFSRQKGRRKKRDMFSPRRQTRRRNPIRLIK
ncbi:MAG: rod shape-determining protein MreD [Acidobacteriota bacterium]